MNKIIPFSACYRPQESTAIIETISSDDMGNHGHVFAVVSSFTNMEPLSLRLYTFKGLVSKSTNT